MLITAFVQFQPKGHREPCNEVGSLSPAEQLVEFELESCYVWAGAPSCFLELLEKPQKADMEDCCSSLAASLEPLAHCQNVASLCFFYRNYFDRC